MAALRALISFSLAAILLRMVVKSGGEINLWHEFASCKLSLLVLASIFYGMGIALSSWRWALLLRVQQVNLDNWNALRLTMIGVFFNLAIPGGVGGDVIKMVYLAKVAKERSPEAIMTTLFDRILGLLGLFVVALAALAYRWDFVKAAPTNLQVTITGVCSVAVAGGLGVLVALFSDQFLQIPLLGSALKTISQKRPRRLWRLIRKVVKSISLFRNHLGALGVALGCSVVIHVVTTLAVVCIGYSVGASHLQLSDYFLAVQVANTVAAIPLFPGGIGGRDYILLLFFQAAGEGSKRAVIGPFLSLLVVAWGLVGGLVFLFDKQPDPSTGNVPAEPKGQQTDPLERLDDEP